MGVNQDACSYKKPSTIEGEWEGWLMAWLKLTEHSRRPSANTHSGRSVGWVQPTIRYSVTAGGLHPPSMLRTIAGLTQPPPPVLPSPVERWTPDPNRE